MHRIALSLAIALVIGVSGCDTIPPAVSAIQPFEKERYLGQWYEIARFDFSFEKNLNNTTAHYSLNGDGSIKVVNKGYDTVANKWTEAEGRAVFTGSDSVASLKVSFFGPFYGGYNVIALDTAYTYAMVCGGNKDYLWILSRATTIPEEIKSDYVNRAKNLGFATENLLWIQHNP